ncbi:MAG: YqgE/AlgH family protein [Actinobacteria bacterium]|nr:YqgE/AlgH family protein [Actinomycetota bacterium]
MAIIINLLVKESQAHHRGVAIPPDEPLIRPATGPLTGRLLVAVPGMYDANFDRTVVLVLEHGDEGAVGIVLNQPSDTETGAAVPGWGAVAAPPAVVFVGGPVLPAGALALGQVSDPSAAEGWTAVLGPVGLVDLGRATDGAPPDVERARLFAGHAGWSPGQLEGEIAAGGWFVVDAEPGDAFASRPAGLWRAVLARQRGRLAWFANCPPDPSAN